MAWRAQARKDGELDQEGARAKPAAQLLLSLALLVLAMVSMQTGAAFAKRLFPLVGPQGATALRLGFAALILAFVQRPWRGLSGKGARLSLAAYGLSLGLMNTCFYLALRTVPLGVAIALEFLGPLAVASFGSRRWLDGAWIALAVGGVALLLPLGRAVHAIDPGGAALALASGVCWGLYIVFGRRVGQTYGARGASLGMIIAACAFVPIDAAAAGPRLLSLAVVPAGLLLAVLSSAAPYTLEMVALARLPPRLFGMFMSLEPAVGALAGLAVLGERPAPAQWAGIAAVVAASLGASLTLQAPDEPLPT
jgi:inner membrane transporter RhtA